MDIPKILLKNIGSGDAVLVLGAGASIGASSPDGRTAPTTAQLADAIAEKFLGDEHMGGPLSSVVELAASESDTQTVQDFIGALFKDLGPAPFHMLLPTFRWKAIATTNFDLVVERTYAQCNRRSQDLVPLIKNGDRVEEKLKSQRSLRFLKLHGCITRTSDQSIPLILTPDQYITHRSGRDRLFDQLKTFSYEHPLIFVGHSLQDPDIRQFLLELGEDEIRPRYYTVTPQLTAAEKRLWEGRRITPLVGSFEDFLSTLDKELSSAFRGVTTVPALPNLPISERFIVQNPGLSPSCSEFLESDVEYVRDDLSIEALDPRLFYRGLSPRWSAVDADLDVRRDLEDTILYDAVLDESDETNHRFYAIKGHAGSGKSVLLQRIAWEAANTYKKLCLFVQPHGTFDFESLSELSKVVGERIYLFVDDVGDHVPQIVRLLERAGHTSIALTIFAAERINEWNMSCSDLEPYLTDEFEVRYLSPKEIDELLALLQHHRALFRLEKASDQERREAFVNRAGRQLLVALHEATLGKPFEDIIAGEYDEITPLTAKTLYLGICFLNRYNVPVRAGIVNRVYGIRFTEFRQHFFRPLESLIFARYDRRTGDYTYKTRHPHIAQIVVDRALGNVSDNLSLHRQMLMAMNIDYDADRNAFKRLVRGREILNAFPDHQMASSVYTTARQRFGQEPYLLQQEALYEMHRPNGNLTRANSLLNRAKDKTPFDRTLTHSLAELELRRSEDAKTALEAEAHLREAERLVRPLITNRVQDSYPFHTLAKVQLERLKAFLGDCSIADTDLLINDRINAVEAVVQEGLQKFPDDTYLLDVESQLASLLSDDDRAMVALKSAFTKVPDNAFIAIRLAKLFIAGGDIDEAIVTYKASIGAGVNDKRVYFNYARLLIDQNNTDESEITYYLRRAFTEGDSNIEAQFWYARQLYVSGEIAASRGRFRELKRLPINPQMKRNIRGIMRDNQGETTFTGTVERLEYDYGFLSRDGTGDQVFFHIKNVDDEVWELLERGNRVSFSIGFNFWGANAIHLRTEY